MPLDGARDFRHLPEGEHPLLHPGAARDGVADDGQMALGRVFKESRNLVADRAPHGAHHELGFHDKEAGTEPADRAGAGEDPLVFRTLFARGFRFFVIVGEADRVAEGDGLVHFAEGTGVRQVCDAYPRRYAVVFAALRADELPLGERAFGDFLLALFAGDGALGREVIGERFVLHCFHVR